MAMALGALGLEEFVTVKALFLLICRVVSGGELMTRKALYSLGLS